MTSTVRHTLRDGVLHLIIAAPHRRNALSRNIIGRLRELVAELPREQVKAVVISGERGTFSSGADFADLTGRPQIWSSTTKWRRRSTRCWRPRSR
jgi:enoyl-CoA hydratase/carnithine racemase